MTLVLFLAVGAVAGLLAGLFGIGGGLIIVPTLIHVFRLQGLSEGLLTHLAVGSSLATIVVTSISSVRSHHRHGAVRWELFRRFAPGLCVGVWLGVQTAGRLSGATLQMLIGVFCLVVGAQMVLALQPKPSRQLPGTFGLASVGGGVGYLSALFGIGGGSLTVPFLSWCNVRMQQAVATSAACGLPIAMIGALTYLLEGWGRTGLPAYSSGFVYWPAVLGIALTSTYFARHGARLAHHLSPPRLKQAFGVLLLAIGAQFIF
ncbi:MAG: sulfite exporter TauE/SafE family protein [Pseudomonadota bacterium]|nr:sulfite exporter TauE/SafE family protein [Pseudomonadota bacterium]